MHTRSLIPKPKTTVIGLGTREIAAVEYGWHEGWNGLFP